MGPARELSLYLTFQRRDTAAAIVFPFYYYKYWVCLFDALSPGWQPVRALGVTLDVISHQGGYAPGSTVPERKYIDPSCPPSAAGHVFFGWLRPLV